MKVHFNRLKTVLKQPPVSAYLVVGEEPWQRMTAADAIKTCAKAEGYTSELFFHDAGFDIRQLRNAAQTGNLFGGEKRLLDVRIESKITTPTIEFFRSFHANPLPDMILLVQSPKADARSAWVKSFASSDNAVAVTVYNKSGDEFAKWLKDYIAEKNMLFEASAEALLLTRVDGNLLAAANAIEKIALSYDNRTPITSEQVSVSVGDGSKFNVYDLADAAVAGDLPRLSRVLHGLRSENAPLPLVLWSLTHRVRQLAASDKPAQYGTPATRQATARALKRKVSWKRLLHRCAAADEIIKKTDATQGWNEIFGLTMYIGGRDGR